ncbi:MAG: hypothetical protein NVSMB2_22770 [Chloroflexota bacterium]
MTGRVTRRDRGQSLVEFALVVPLFLLLVFALIDFSRMLYTYVSLSNAAREMARVGAVSTNWSSINTVNAFNNYAMFGGGRDATTDSVTTLSGTGACARARDAGGTCTTVTAAQSSLPMAGATMMSVPCPMTSTPTSSNPLSNCTLYQPPSAGFVEVQVAYTFQFNPLFQNRLSGVIDVSFMNPTVQLNTTARSYVE